MAVASLVTILVAIDQASLLAAPELWAEWCQKPLPLLRNGTNTRIQEGRQDFI